MLAVRLADDVLGNSMSDTAALPIPELGLNVIHGDEVLAFQGHCAPTEIVSIPAPPTEEKEMPPG